MSATVTTAQGPACAQTAPNSRFLLREATAAAHARLDAAFSRLDLQSLPDYRRFLQANAAALLPLEGSLVQSGVAELFPDWTLRSRTAALVRDLMALGGDAPGLEPLRQLDREAMLGTLYVLEGSRLGAAYLLPNVEQSPDPLVAGSVAYLSHGAGLRLWQSYCARLEQQSADIDDPAKMIDGALQAFALFEHSAERVLGAALSPARSTVAL
jgi:heme oxygenase (biliverdin-IX-beta and delta-forming)